MNKQVIEAYKKIVESSLPLIGADEETEKNLKNESTNFQDAIDYIKGNLPDTAESEKVRKEIEQLEKRLAFTQPKRT